MTSKSYSGRKVRKIIEKTLDPKRFEHTLGVAYTAAALAMCYEENVIGCVFDYVKQSDNKSKQIKKIENKKQDTKSLCIKLIDLFEENTNILLQDEIKKELLEN